ncbi:RraA family protein [Paracoccus laeviglucosivorans]|uniref:Putative 4-hydroxy-4-methyl-2-oxoglutarate aldolase n=1 Tax=Paracoccus laeviglucosivorans TaxID=1197861 RepID=A0A521EQB2_9RHOB|nr:RraA family protein [Paracoccus laeviglucosivorans]SMO85300.1 Regulator of RNase E activity RraA [Paracoccus laeviglucosivorans]
MAIGFRILSRERAVSSDTVARFKELPVANVSDSMYRVTAAGPRLQKMHRSGVMAGPALTVKSRPGDNLMLHKAIDLAQPGDVIVCDAGGDLTNSLMGELMLAYALKRGVAGFVLNGAIRDADAFVATNMPVWAAGITHRGPYKDGPGEINVPIAIDGMVIEPGDLIMGDSDGVLAVPFAHAEEIYSRTVAKQESEQKQMAAIEAGTNDRSWVDAALKRMGCEYPA